MHDNRPDIPVTTQDVLDVVRDHYEGTDFDLTKGLASGNYVIVAGLVSLGGGVAHLCDALVAISLGARILHAAYMLHMRKAVAHAM